MYGPRLEQHRQLMDSGMAWAGFAVHLLIWAAMIALAVYLIRTYSRHTKNNSVNRDPLDIARERFAKGEITKEQLAEIKKELK